MANIEEEKRKAYEQINTAWKNAKVILDNPDNGDSWEKANMLLQIEMAKVQEDERNLLSNLAMALWDYASIKANKRMKGE